MGSQIYEQMAVGAFGCNCYIVGDTSTKKAIVIDAGDQPDDILAAVHSHGLDVVAILATHAHLDHVLGAQILREKTGAPFYLHRGDTDILATMQQSAVMWLGMEVPPPPEVDRYYSDGDEITAGELKLLVIETPGHTPGSVSLLVPDLALFSGDTLFRGSVGRTDLPGGNQEKEFESIRQKLFGLDDLPVFPGHGPSTSVHREKVENPFVGSRATG